MKFSIILPSYDQGKFIGKALESIFTQKGNFEIECLVFDGGSTDNTVEILKNYESRIKNNEFKNLNRGINFFWQSEKDKGQSDAINKGLRKITGDIIAYLNTDDTYAENSFQKVCDAFKKNSKKKWLTGYCHIIDEKDKIIQKYITRYKNWWLNHYSFKKLLVINFISQPATFWKKDLFDFFDENLHYTMDYDYWLRIGSKNDPIIVKDYLANFRIQEKSKGKTQFIKQFDQDLETCEKYSRSKIIKYLHSLHNFLIVSAYKIIK